MNTLKQEASVGKPLRRIWLVLLLLVACALAIWGFVALRPSKSVAMSLQNISSTSADLVIRNQSGRELEFGEDYAVERYDGQDWVSVERQPGYGFGLVGYSLLPKESRTFHLRWESSYGALTPGRYRVSKRFSPRGIDAVCYAEFTVDDK